MPTLAEVREELKAKRDAMADVFREAGPDLDMGKVTVITGTSQEKAAEIKRRNDEMSALGKQLDELLAVEAVRTQNEAALKQLDAPATRPPFSNGVAPAQQQAAERKGIGELFTDSVAYKGYERAMRRGPVAELEIGDAIGRKAVLTEVGYAPQAVRTGLILPGALRRPMVADLMPSGTTDQIAIVYMEETTTTSAAAAVAEGAVKPESTLAFTQRTAPVSKIATVLPVTDELLADVPALQAYIEARLRLFLALEEERELLLGGGVSPEMTGLENVTGILTQALGTDVVPDGVYKAMVKILTTSFLDPTGLVTNPLDWQNVKLLKTADGFYIWGAPNDPGPDRIWGLDVVSTPVQTQHTMLVGAFETAAQVFRRMGVAFAISDQHSDFFIRNQLMLRIEERLALAVYRPSGFSLVTGLP